MGSQAYRREDYQVSGAGHDYVPKGLLGVVDVAKLAGHNKTSCPIKPASDPGTSSSDRIWPSYPNGRGTGSASLVVVFHSQRRCREFVIGMANRVTGVADSDMPRYEHSNA